MERRSARYTSHTVETASRAAPGGRACGRRLRPQHLAPLPAGRAGCEGRTFIIPEAGKPLVKVLPLDTPQRRQLMGSRHQARDWVAEILRSINGSCGGD
jgi:hypothetical protein